MADPIMVDQAVDAGFRAAREFGILAVVVALLAFVLIWIGRHLMIVLVPNIISTANARLDAADKLFAFERERWVAERKELKDNAAEDKVAFLAALEKIQSQNTKIELERQRVLEIMFTTVEERLDKAMNHAVCSIVDRLNALMAKLESIERDREVHEEAEKAHQVQQRPTRRVVSQQTKKDEEQ